MGKNAELARLVRAKDQPVGLGELPPEHARDRLSLPPIHNAPHRVAQPGDGKEPNWLKGLYNKLGFHGQKMINYRFLVQTESSVVFPFNADRAYILLVNNGTAEVRIGVGRSATLFDGIPLPASGGFWEPILGTVDSVHAVSTAVDQELIIVEGFYFNKYFGV